MLGLRLAYQTSKMDEGYIDQNALTSSTYRTIDAATDNIDAWDNPPATDFFPQEETTYLRLTAAGDLSEHFSYNVKGSYADFQQAYTGGGELYECPTLNGVAHTTQLADDPTDLDRPNYRVPIPLPSVDCSFDNSRGWNDVPPAIAAVNPLLNQFGGGDSGEKYESRNSAL